MSVKARHPLHIVIVAEELLQATGGRMEQMEQQMGQMSDMQMSFSCSASTFSSSMSSTKLR